MRCYALLVDIVSIQRYVFGSNRLRENLGASFLITEAYESLLKQVLKTLFKGNLNESDLDLWITQPAYSAIDDGKPFEVAYIGGGNAMLFFKEEEMAKALLREWTKQLLLYAPGLSTAAAIGAFDTDKFDESKKRLFETLTRNKNLYAPLTAIPRHGITAECSHSGYSMDIYSPSEGQYVSSVTNAKIKAAVKAKDKIHNLFKDEIGADYCFTDDIGNLGQKAGEDNHIAIVHIDGNSMADRFASQGSIKALRELSISVNYATINSVKAMINAFKEHKDMLIKFLDIKGFKKEAGKEVLPFRPIIIGGDDITFVSEGRLGIWLAEQFLAAFEKQSVSDQRPLDASAGVAITKSKYPFYRGYRLSEELCKSAKTKRRENASQGSWIDFHIAYGGISGDLEHIRRQQYTVTQGSLLMRPYCLKTTEPEHDFKTFKSNAKSLSTLPNNKIKEMREVLTLGEEQTKMFVKEMKARGDDKKIPEISGRNFKTSLFEDAKTPYFDMIELMDFYPGLKEV
ncbi:MAG: Cas10/Cmr2 second palm domain-containing protein [Thermodesulfovibrionales bacterium]